MTQSTPRRAHLIAGGFPSGSHAGHDHDYARLRLLGLLAEGDLPASTANDFADVERWLLVEPAADHVRGRPVSRRRAVPRHPRLARGGRALARPARDERRPRRAGRGLAAAPDCQDRAPRAARGLLLDPSADLQDPS